MSTRTSKESTPDFAVANKRETHANSVKDNLVRTAEDAINTLLNLLFEKADEGLAEMSGSEESEQIDKIYLETMGVMRLNMTIIKKHYFDELLDSFKSFDKKDYIKSEEDSINNRSLSSLELIGEQAMDEDMIINNMADRQEAACQQNLHHLTARMQVLYDYDELNTNEHPASPHSIARIFCTVLNECKIEYETRKIIYELFDKYVMSKLFTVYTKMNKLLIENNILPEISFAIIRSTGGNISGSSANGHPITDPSQDYNYDWDTVDSLSPAQENAGPLLSRTGLHSDTKIPANSIPDNISSNMLPQHGIIPTLTDIQVELVDSASTGGEIANPMEIGNKIITVIRQSGFSSVNSDPGVDEEIILTISEIFDFLLEDNDIPKQIKGALARLQIPYLKAALIDKDLLQDIEHPARVLINNITQASIGWDYSRIKSDIFRKIESIVDEIIAQYEEDSDIFNRLSDDFNAYWKHHTEINKAYEERSWKTTEGKERIEYANKRVDAWVHMWCMRNDTIDEVKTFLKESWKNSLLFFLHKYGEDSRQWTYNIKLINCLIWSTTPGKNLEETKELIQILPILIRGLNRGLLATATHPSSIANIFQTFSRCHLEIIENGMSGKIPGTLPINNPAKITSLESIDRAYTHTHDDTNTDVENDQHKLETLTPVAEANESPVFDDAEPADSIQDEYMILAETLENGDWLEFTTDEGNKVKAKFAWASSLTSNRLFVRPDGSRFAVISLEQIAADLRCGKSRIIDNTPLFDRALNQAAQ